MQRQDISTLMLNWFPVFYRICKVLSYRVREPVNVNATLYEHQDVSTLTRCMNVMMLKLHDVTMTLMRRCINVMCPQMHDVNVVIMCFRRRRLDIVSSDQFDHLYSLDKDHRIYSL